MLFNKQVLILTCCVIGQHVKIIGPTKEYDRWALAAGHYEKLIRDNCTVLLGHRNIPFIAELKNGKLPPSVLEYLENWITSKETIAKRQLKKIYTYAQSDQRTYKFQKEELNAAAALLWKGY